MKQLIMNEFKPGSFGRLCDGALQWSKYSMLQQEKEEAQLSTKSLCIKMKHALKDVKIPIKHILIAHPNL